LHTEIPEIRVENTKPSTNMVFFEWAGTNMSPTEFLERCIQHGVRFSHFGERRFRAVTHMQITRDDIKKVIATLKTVCLSK
jgi:threonine aldolase